MEKQQCAQCGKQIDANTPLGEFCSECAAKIRSELALSFPIKQIWIWLSKRLVRLPVVTLALVAVNAGVYLFIKTNSVSGYGQSLPVVLEMHGASVIHGQWWRLLTSAFLHIRLSHLIGNVVLLCVLGRAAEQVIGRVKLVLLWMTSGIAGSIAELYSRQPQSASFGASGVVYGLAGILLYVYYFRQGILPNKIRYRRIALLMLFVTIGFLGEWYVFGRPTPGHAGGLLAGFLFASLIPVARGKSHVRILSGVAGLMVCLSVATLLAIRRQRVWVELDAIDPTGFYSVDWGSIPKLEQIVAARPDILRAHILLAEAYQSGHRYEDAIREYKFILVKQPSSERAWYRMGWAYMDSGRPEDAIDAFSRSLKIDSENLTAQNAHIPSLKTAMDREAFAVRTDREALARAYEAAGRIDKAMEEYSEILRTSADDYTANQELKRLAQLPHTSDSTNRTKEPSKH